MDQTLGTSSGRYLYREATNNFNQQADLTSPVIDLSGADQPILEFYYHMFGRDIGELRMDVFSGGVWNLDVITPLIGCLLYTSPSPRDQRGSRMPSSA